MSAAGSVSALARVAELIADTDHISFLEIAKVLESAGVPVDGSYGVIPRGSRDTNVQLWGGVSEEFCDLVTTLVGLGLAHWEPIVPAENGRLVYLADGWAPDLPIATPELIDGGYDQPHWLPVVFRPGRRP